ncbi:type II toxin-antitoxin system VapB family antitoxin [Rhizobium beringeri]
MTSSPSLNCRDVDVYLYDNHTLEARSRTNIGIDDALLDAAMTATGLATKRPSLTGPCEVSLRAPPEKCDRRSRRDRLGRRPRRDTSRPAGR